MVSNNVTNYHFLLLVQQVIMTPESSNMQADVFIYNRKRPRECLSDKIELSIAKVLRHSLPTNSSDLQRINNGTLTQVVNRKSEPVAKPKTLITKVSPPTDPIKHNTIKSTGNS